MSFKNPKFLRIFIFILATMFMANTVYANGMMIDDQLCASHNLTHESHSHDHAITQHDHKHHDNQVQSASDHCSKCGHCMACLTIFPPSQLGDFQAQVNTIEIRLFEPAYYSHINNQPKKPPIS